MGGRGGGSPATRAQSAQDAGPPSIEAAIEQAWSAHLRSLGRDPTDGFENRWVSLADLRGRLTAMGFTREEVDRGLFAISKSRRAMIIPEENQKTINARDRAAQLMMSGEAKHLIMFD